MGVTGKERGGGGRLRQREKSRDYQAQAETLGDGEEGWVYPEYRGQKLRSTSRTGFESHKGQRERRWW